MKKNCFLVLGSLAIAVAFGYSPSSYAFGSGRPKPPVTEPSPEPSASPSPKAPQMISGKMANDLWSMGRLPTPTELAGTSWKMVMQFSSNGYSISDTDLTSLYEDGLVFAGYYRDDPSYYSVLKIERSETTWLPDAVDWQILSTQSTIRVDNGQPLQTGKPQVVVFDNDKVTVSNMSCRLLEPAPNRMLCAWFYGQNASRYEAYVRIDSKPGQ